MADDSIQPAAASDVLGGAMPPPATGIQPASASDATTPGGMLQPGNVSDNPDATAMLQPGGVSDDGSPAFMNQAAADPELHAAAIHHGRIASALLTAAHHISDTLGGSATFKVTQDANGNPIIQKTDATEGEKWGRIAAGILAGAAKGFAAGQGPGGAAKAVGAGFDQGIKQAGQQKQQATEDLDQAQKQVLFSANMAHLNQQIIKQTWDNKHLDRDDLQKQETYALQHMKEMDDLGIQPIMSGVKDGKTLAQYGIANPLAVGAHMGQGGAMIYNEPDGKGGVNIYQLSASQANQRTTTPDTVEIRSVDPDDPTKTKLQTMTMPAGETVKDRAARRMGLIVQGDNAIKAAQQAKIAQENADTKKQEAKDKAPLVRAQTSEASARAEQINRTLKGQPGGQPVEVEDPNYPSPTNFPVGTLGIAKPPKTGDYKIPAEAEGAYRLSKIMGESGDLIRRTATENPQLFGRLQGLLSQGKTIVGLSNSKDDQALATLAGSIQQYSQASAGFHRFRNKAAPAETEESSLNKFRNDPASIVAYLDSQKPALSQTEKLIKNYQVYGTPDGPSPEARAAAVSRAPNAAKFQQGGGAPQPQNPSGATVQRPAGATMEYKDAQGNVTGWAVNGKYVAR